MRTLSHLYEESLNSPRRFALHFLLTYNADVTAEQLVAKWQDATLKERSAAQEHFIDLCRLLEEKTPAEADPKGEFYAFERRVSKAAGGKGFADRVEKGLLRLGVQGQTRQFTRCLRATPLVPR